MSSTDPSSSPGAGAPPHTDEAVALVAGGSRGLGLLIARDLLRRGFRVVALARDADELACAAADLATEGDVRGMPCDVRDAEQVRRVVDEVEATMGAVEVAIHVAGIIQVGPAETMTLEHYREAIDTMALGPIHLTLAVLPAMRERRRGRIGVVTSVGGMVSAPHLLPYSTAKFAAVGFTDGLAAELAGTGVTATTIVPGLMRTGSHERARFTGDHDAEYAWFAPAASLPGLAMDAERAARRIVTGTLRGSPLVVLTPLAWLAIRARGLAPATTTRLMGIAIRLLPDAPAHPTGTVEGAEPAQRAPGVVRALTRLGSRAARLNHERHGAPDPHR